MAENEDQPVIVTAAELAKIIEHYSVYGEYDEYHEWSLYYSFQDKAGLLEKLLIDWERTEADGQKLILQFTRTLIKEFLYGPSLLAEILVRSIRLAGIVEAVSGSLVSGVFAHALLVAMKNHQVRQEDWLAKIRELTAGRKFSERQRDLKDLYPKIQELVEELSSF
jgi:hypothetical protein